MILEPFNNIVVAEFLGKTVEDSEIVVPDRQIGQFVRLRVLAKGELVTWLTVGDIVIANAMLEVIDPANPKIGFINSKNILARQKEGTYEQPIM